MANSKYYDNAAVVQVIGCSLLSPSLLDNDGKYFYNESDFVSDFHKVVFGSILNMHNMGATRVTIKDIENYLETRPESKAIYNASRGSHWVLETMENADLSNFEYYYNRMKKMTLFRAYERVGVDLKFLYDPDEIFDVAKKKRQEDFIDNKSLNELSDIIENKILDVRAIYVDNATDEAEKLGDSIFDILENLRATPEMGSMLYGRYVNTLHRGARLGKLYIRSAASGVGKCVPNSTIIPSVNGDVKVGDVKVGDYLFDAFGKPTKVLAVYPQGNRQIWEVEFKDGRVAKCCKDHLWSFCTYGQKKNSKNNRKFYTKTIEEISKMELKNNDGSYNILVPMQKAVHYEEKIYPIEPYVLGLILGDGSFRISKSNKAFMYSSADYELVKNIEKQYDCTAKKYNDSSYSWFFELNKSNSHKNLWVEEVLKDYSSLLNVKSEDKFIPNEFLYGSIDQRIDLLNGLLDTDGSVDNKGRVSYFTVSEKLKDDVILLCNSLGFKTHVIIDTHKDTLPCYVIKITGSPEDKIKLFNLSRKKEKIINWFNNSNRKEDNLFNPIVSITKTDDYEEMTCFYVDNDEHLFLMNDYIVTHNTRTMIADLCTLGCNEIYDLDKKEWVKNGICEPVLYISTELDIQEVSTMCMAFLSGVNEEHILTGRYDFGEEERVMYAADIISKSPLYIEEMPNFTLKDVENVIKRSIRTKKTQYVLFDYLHSSMGILQEISRASNGTKLREDNILFMFAVKLKDIANQFNVFILTSTQLNQSWKTDEIPDQNLLRGSKAIADRVDWGSILLDATQDDMEALQGIISKMGCVPNVKLSVYKNRRGSFNKMYLWMYADKSICRFDGLFATDYNYNLLPINETEIVVS